MSDRDTREGLACGVCGDDPATWERINNDPVALCDDCYADLTDICPTCERKHWQADMVRIGDALYCASDALHHPAVASCVMAAISREGDRK